MAVTVDAPEFTVVIPDDVEAEPSPTPDDEQTFTCDECGFVSHSRKGLGIHVGHSHPGREDLLPGRAPKGTKTDVPRGTTTPRRPRTPAKGKRVEQIKRNILDDFNPLMLQTATNVVGIPEGMLGVTMPAMGIVKPLREEITFSDFQAGVIAKGIVEMDSSDVVQTVARVVGPVMPYVFGFAALLTVGLHGLKLWMIRSKMVQLVASQQQGSDGGTDRPQFV